MCYNVYMKLRRRVGVRALRQSLSVFLRRVESGDSFEVTDRGRPVAMLTPLRAGATALERLVASGRATLPEGDVLDLGAPPRTSRRLSQALLEQRAERL
jgi:prevent-host-death family protein